MAKLRSFKSTSKSGVTRCVKLAIKFMDEGRIGLAKATLLSLEKVYGKGEIKE